MKKRHLWIFAFVLLTFLFAISCVTVSNKPPRITYGGEFLEDRSTWGSYKFQKHFGIDYYTACGAPLIAAADGTVLHITNMDNIIPDS